MSKRTGIWASSIPWQPANLVCTSRPRDTADRFVCCTAQTKTLKNPQVKRMEISVIGAGYVGLTTAACLAEIGHRVLCADSDLGKLASLHKGTLPFFEPHLDD